MNKYKIILKIFAVMRKWKTDLKKFLNIFKYIFDFKLIHLKDEFIFFT